MKVLFDHQAFLAEYSGISNCFVQLIKHLPDEVQYEIGVVDSENIHLIDSKLTAVRPYRLRRKNFLSDKHFPSKGHLYDLYRLLFPLKTSEGVNQKYNEFLLDKGDIDIFHTTFYEPFFLKHLHGVPFVITIHDMIPEKTGKYDKAKEWKKMLAGQASHIICVSESTMQDVKDILHVPDNKLSVIYHAGPTDVPPCQETSLFPFPYILYVGMRGGYKNFDAMIRSMASVLRSHPEIKLVCTGDEFSSSEQALFQQLGIVDQVVFKYFRDGEITTLYHHALCFIYPSLLEGFGIPILEAYTADCPVLLNRTTCFPEIAKDAALYFDLHDEKNNLAQTLEGFLSMTPEQRKALIQRQQIRREYFSWQKSARQLADIYRNILKLP